MAAQSIYIKIVRLSLRPAAHLSSRRLDELNEYVPQLREQLSCVVCCQLLMDPYAPKGARCGHNVCRLCIRGRKRLMPSCAKCIDCSDFKTYEENRVMAVQLLCYKTICVHLLQSSLFARLSNLPVDVRLDSDTNTPRIKLPAKTTQDFIREGASYDDMRDTFLPQPDLKELKIQPSSMPVISAPTTAATTPELPYEQQLPELLSFQDIEMEAAATAEQDHFAHPLPIMPTGSRVLTHSMLSQPQVHQTAAYLDTSWNEQVDLSAALSLSNFPETAITNNGTSYTYVLANAPTVEPTLVMQATSDRQMPAIGQVLQVMTSTRLPAAPAIQETTDSRSIKRKHSELDDVDYQPPEISEEESSDEEATAPAAGTRMNLRKKNATIKSSVQIKPPLATANATVPTAAELKSMPTQDSTRKPVKKLVHKGCCRCGTTSKPGKMTCRNNRCPCYSNGLGCLENSTCNGCKNPHARRHEDDKGEELSEPSSPEPDIETQKVQRGETIQQQPPFYLVPLDNMSQLKTALVLMQNENGGLQSFNIFGSNNEPIDPATVGFQRVPLGDVDGNSSMPKFAYIVPPGPAASQELTDENSPPVVEQPAKKFKNVTSVETIVPPNSVDATNFQSSSSLAGPFSPIESLDEFVGGNSDCNEAAAGDSNAADEAALEEILSDSDLDILQADDFSDSSFS